jgi:hypothetical protein
MLHYILGEKNEHSINDEFLEKYGFREIYEASQGTLKVPKPFCAVRLSISSRRVIFSRSTLSDSTRRADKGSFGI